MDSQNVPMPLNPICWIAVRADSPAAVAEAVGIDSPQPCSWEEGQRLSFKYGERVFVSPPVRGGWIVVAAPRFEPSERSATDPFLELLRELSETFDECFHFSEDNSMPWCTWVWCRGGKVLRAYHFQTEPECEVLWNVGEPPPEERALRFYRIQPGYEGPVAPPEADKWLLCEGQVRALARAWCFDPSDIASEDGAAGVSGLTTGDSDFEDEEFEDAEFADDAGDEFDGMPKSIIFDASAGGTGGIDSMRAMMQGDFPPMMQPSAQAMQTQEDLERLVARIDTRHLLERYAEDKGEALPPPPFGENCADLAELSECFGTLSGPMGSMLPKELRIAVGSVAAGAALRHYREVLRPRR